MSRKEARERVFQLVFERVTTQERNELTLEKFIRKLPDSAVYIQSVYDGLDARLDFFVNQISRYAKGFSGERIFKVDLSLLLVATYEILFVDDVPERVAINEALDLVKRYSTEKSAAYINGILANFVKEKERILHIFTHGEEEEREGEEGENEDSKSEGGEVENGAATVEELQTTNDE